MTSARAQLPSVSPPDPAPDPGELAPAVPHELDAIFREHGGYVLGLCRRLGVEPADAEDVAQDVFMAVQRALPSFEQRSALRTWVCGVCLRTVANYRRTLGRRRKRERPTSSGEELAAVPAGQERSVEQQEARVWLEQALDSLPDKQREVFVLFEIEELPMDEVARAIGCSGSTAYGRLYAAREAIASRYRRHHGSRP